MPIQQYARRFAAHEEKYPVLLGDLGIAVNTTAGGVVQADWASNLFVRGIVLHTIWFEGDLRGNLA